MWLRFRLKQRIYLILAVMVAVSVIACLVTIGYTFRVEHLITTLIDSHVAAFETAEALDNALVNQKGYISYYFQDSDAAWLTQLAHYRRIFEQRLEQARSSSLESREQALLDQIASRYKEYIRLKDRAIELYQIGERETGTGLNRQARAQYFDILSLSEALKNRQIEGIRFTQRSTYAETARLRLIAAGVAIAGFVLAAALAFILIRQVLNPISRLLQTTFSEQADDPSDNVVTALSRSVEGLIHNVDQTQNELAKSREHLLQAEKMAMVGKLAAGMAHSIRNPFTSVKMRLFSLGRALQMTSAQKEDFEVISEEIRHIDTIVQNFLEFSRPPKLVMQAISPSTVVDNTLQLLSHRLKSYEVTIRLIRPSKLPPVSADPEQLKEVLVNLMVNACEAFEQGGGVITIEELVAEKSGRRHAVVRLSDNGPGVPPEIREQVLQPFFTTKDDGTGLGLSIAQRIMDEHGGRLILLSRQGRGAAFEITLPIEEIESEYNSRY